MWSRASVQDRGSSVPGMRLGSLPESSEGGASVNGPLVLLRGRPSNRTLAIRALMLLGGSGTAREIAARTGSLTPRGVCQVLRASGRAKPTGTIHVLDHGYVAVWRLVPDGAAFAPGFAEADGEPV